MLAVPGDADAQVDGFAQGGDWYHPKVAHRRVYFACKTATLHSVNIGGVFLGVREQILENRSPWFFCSARYAEYVGRIYGLRPDLYKCFRSGKATFSLRKYSDVLNPVRVV